MSAPQTNIETQKRRHRGPLVGITLVVVFALGLLFWMMTGVADEGTPVDNGMGQIDGRTGNEVEDPAASPAIPATPPAATATPDPANPPAATP